MLCTKIIITNDKRDNAQKLLDFIKNSNVFFEHSSIDGSCIVNVNADDEKLYEICCKISEYIMYTAVKADIKKTLDAEYSCFNNDEKELICSSVFMIDELSELTGRIYIYLKYNKAVNPLGFYRFMCRDIAEAVSEAVLIEADKIIGLNDTEDFIRLLRYFSSMSPFCAEKAELIADSAGIRILEVKNREENYGSEFASMELAGDDVLSELVNLNPSSIVIHGKKFFDSDDMAEVINGVFGERITFCTGCALCSQKNSE